MNDPNLTYYAPAERKDLKTILEEARLVLSAENVVKILNALPYFALILNQERQVVFSNQSLLAAFGLQDSHDVLGTRPGEMFQCIHAHEQASGCGTSRSCRYCGAVNVILQSQKTREEVTDECRITSFIDGRTVNFDLNVTAKPFNIKDGEFTLVFISDISARKQKEILERIFIHDIMNSSWVISGLLDVISRGELDPKRAKLLQQARDTTKRLLEEIQVQRDFFVVEKGQFEPEFVETTTEKILSSALKQARYLVAAKDKQITISSSSITKVLTTEPTLLQRVLMNLLKNALEASSGADVVQMGCSAPDKETVVFWVSNPAVMPEQVRHQVFQRSFSTKGKGRGIGLYSVKILVEQYLAGEVTFESTEEKGTVFRVQVPLVAKNGMIESK